jgi:ubiquinone/menaquinone biosynthesis C-methylase UbiE
VKTGIQSEKYMSKKENEIQRENVANLYNEAAPIYDDSFEGKAEYQIPKILKEIYEKYSIVGGLILDVGCGTGKLKEYLGESFDYEGIDLSPAMIEQAQKRGYVGQVGAVESVIKTLPDKSVDHVVALSSLYFIRDIENLLKEFERVARKSFFVSFEYFEPETIEMMKNKGIKIYNHPNSLIRNPTEVASNTFLWKRPNTEQKIFGDIVFILNS